jgi:hypothetical protein
LGVRDWDLLSLPALPLAFFCGRGFFQLLSKEGRVKTALVILAVTVLVHSLTWVWVNTDMNRGVRFIDFISQADYHRGDSKVQLAHLLGNHGFIRESIRQNLLTRGPKRYRAFLNIGKTYWENRMPDSTFYYCKKIFGENLSGIPFSLAGYVLLCVAYDAMGKPDSATMYYLDMKTRNIEPFRTDLIFWRDAMNYLGYSYMQRIIEQPLNDDLILFFLRYYTIMEEEEYLDLVYQHILKNQFDGEAWMTFLGFAIICEHKDYIELLAKEALRQHPELKISIKYSDQEEVKNTEY